MFAAVATALTAGARAELQVDITREHYQALLFPAAGERLYVKPRQVRVFVEAEAAAR